MGEFLLQLRIFSRKLLFLVSQRQHGILQHGNNCRTRSFCFQPSQLRTARLDLGRSSLRHAEDPAADQHGGRACGFVEVPVDPSRRLQGGVLRDALAVPVDCARILGAGRAVPRANYKIRRDGRGTNSLQRLRENLWKEEGGDHVGETRRIMRREGTITWKDGGACAREDHVGERST